MKLSYKLVIIAFILAFIGGLAWSANNSYSRFLEERTRAAAAEQRADSANAITANVMHTVSVINTISEANQDARKQIALESQGAAHNIKVAVAVDDCSTRPVPADAAKQLHDYANSLRSGSGSTATSKPDR